MNILQKRNRMKLRAHIVVTGRVQGVFYRAETAARAECLNVTGWVRNLPDGRVEAVFEGEEANVQDMIDFCRHGPADAHVTGIDVRREDWKGEFDDFTIRLERRPIV